MIAQLDSDYLRLRPTKGLSRLLSYALFEGRPLTTRGRWINPLVFAHFSVEKRFPKLKRVDRPIFVLGTGRSGTTVLGLIMSMHRDVGFLNEPKALWHAIYPGEDVIGSYCRGAACYRLDKAHATPSVRRHAERLFGAYLAAVFAERIVDKYPELIFRIPFVLSLFPDAKFIFLVRNGWDTCASVEKWSRRHGGEKNGEIHDWWGANNRKWRLMVEQLIETDPAFSNIMKDVKRITCHTDMAVAEWIVTMREGLRHMKLYPEHFHLVKYENLVHQPRDLLQRLLAFCELEEDTVLMEYAGKKLHPAPVHSRFEIAPILRPLFEQTSQLLGYAP